MKKNATRSLTMLLAFMMVFVMAFGLVGTIGTGNAEAATVTPGKVVGLKATKYNATKVKLTWTKQASAQKYEIYYGYYDESVKGRIWELDGTTTKTTYKTVQAQAWDCYYRVRAVNGNNRGAFSKMVRIKLPVTNYAKQIVPDYGKMYNVARTYTDKTSQGYRYYSYSKKLGFTDDYMEYLVNTGWTIESDPSQDPESVYTVFTKSATQLKVGIKTQDDYTFLMIMIKNNITAD